MSFINQIYFLKCFVFLGTVDMPLILLKRKTESKKSKLQYLSLLFLVFICLETADASHGLKKMFTQVCKFSYMYLLNKHVLLLLVVFGCLLTLIYNINNIAVKLTVLHINSVFCFTRLILIHVFLYIMVAIRFALCYLK